MGSAVALMLLPLACRLPTSFLQDDGYFYAQIAYNLGTRGQSTFDGLHTTSGYHLPWGVVLGAASRAASLFTLDKTSHLFVHLAVALSIAVATARHFFRSNLFRLCAFVVIAANFSLTEMVLVAPIMLGVLRSAVHDGGERGVLRSPETWLAMALPCVRIDLACVPIVVAILLFPKERRRALTLVGATLAGAGAQLVTMKLAFGHFVSVAAWVKASVTLGDLPANIVYNTTISAFQALSFVALAAFSGLALALRRDRSTWILVLASLSFLVAHTIGNVLRCWYWVPSSVGVLFALEHAMSASPAEPSSRALVLSRVARAAVAFFALAFIVHGVRAEIVYAGDQHAATAFLSQLRAVAPKGTRVYTYNSPGYLGFFSGLHIVDGDGLVNDYAYARRLTEGDLAGYFDDEAICHFVSPAADADPVLDYAGLLLRKEDLVPLVLVRRHLASQVDFVLYRLKAARCSP